MNAVFSRSRRGNDAVAGTLRTERGLSGPVRPAEGECRWPHGRRCDVEDRNRVVQAHLGLVHEVAREFANRGMLLEDLIGEGNLGLIRAAQEYDPSVGTRFSTYAYYWIREAIRTALANSVGTIRVPMNVCRLLGRWRRTERVLRQLRGHPPTFEEIATAMGLDRPTQRLVAQALRAAGLGNTADGEVRSRTVLMTDGSTTAEQTMTEREERESIGRRLERLDAAERSVVILRYGLAGEPPMSFDQIGRRVGLPPSAVQRLRRLGDAEARRPPADARRRPAAGLRDPGRLIPTIVGIGPRVERRPVRGKTNGTTETQRRDHELQPTPARAWS